MYTLRFPFELPPFQVIINPEFSAHLGDLQIDFKKQNRFYVLTIKGFPSDDAAAKFIPNLWGGLMWFLINKGFAAIVETKPQKIVFSDDSVKAAENLKNNMKLKIDGEVHGIIDNAQPAIYSSDGSFITFTGGEGKLGIQTSAEDVIKHILEGAAFPYARNAFENKKLKIALELYGAFFTEISQNAKFLTLVMVLESLAESEKKPQEVLDLLNEFHKKIEDFEKEVKKEIDEINPESEEPKSLKSLIVSIESLKNELSFRQEKDSIRKKIWSLVFNTLNKNKDNDAEDIANLAKKIYDKRSTLVHNGSLPSKELSEASANARMIVERVLKAKFIQFMNGNNIIKK